MTPDQFHHCLRTIGWSLRGLADRLDINEHATRRWGQGRQSIPQNVAEWLERLAGAHLLAPLPVGWERQEQVREADNAA